MSNIPTTIPSDPDVTQDENGDRFAVDQTSVVFLEADQPFIPEEPQISDED